MIQTLISIAALLIFVLQIRSELVHIISESNASVNTLAWSPDGTQLAVSRDDGHVEIWRFEQNVISTAPSVTFADEHAHMLQWTPDSRQLVTQGEVIDIHDDAYPAVKMVQRWDAQRGELLERLFQYSGHAHYPLPLPAIAWNSDFTRFAYSNGNKTVLLDGQVFASLEPYPAAELLWSPDDTTLAVVSSDGGSVYRIYTYEVATGDQIMEIYGSDYSVTSILWSPDSQRFVVVSPWINGSGIDYTVTTYLNKDGQDPLRAYTTLPIDEVKVFSNEDFFTTDIVIADEVFPPQTAWSPDSQMLAVSSSTAVDLYVFDTQEKIASLPAAHITALSWHPEGHLLASGSRDGRIRLWTVNSSTDD